MQDYDEEVIEMYMNNFTPEQISDYSDKIYKLHVEKHMQDEEIAKELKIQPMQVLLMRKLLGLGGKHGSLLTQLRVIKCKGGGRVWAISAMQITQIAKDLGLVTAKKYGFKVSNVKPLSFTIAIEEVGALAAAKYGKAKKKPKDNDKDKDED